jgi:hypothetical protein
MLGLKPASPYPFLRDDQRGLSYASIDSEMPTFHYLQVYLATTMLRRETLVIAPNRLSRL